MRVASLAVCALLLSSMPASAMTWQEANKASVAMMNEGKLNEAFDLAWQAAELYEQSPTYKAASHERLLLNAIDIFLRTGKDRAAPSTIRKAIVALKRHVGPEDGTLIAVHEQLSLALIRAGDFEAARDAQDQVINLYAKNFGADSVGHINALLTQARQLKGAMDIVDVRKYLDRASAVTQAVPANHVVRLMVDYEHALLTMETGRKDEAEAMFISVADRGIGQEDAAVKAVLRPTYGMLAYMAFKRGDSVTEDKWVEATRGLPVPEGEVKPLFREVPDTPDNRISVSGQVTIEFMVSTADGRVKETKILEKSGNPQYATSVDKAVRTWRYQPTVPVGDPGTLIRQQQTFGYQYENEEAEIGSRFKRRN